jgi:Flp pilus assembly protein TadG
MTAVRGERGAATVELAFLLPFLLGMAGLVLSLGIGFAMQALVQRAAEGAARAAAVPSDFAAGAYRTQVELEAVARQAGILLPTVALDPLACDRTPCGAGATVAVTARYVWDNPAAGLFNLLRGEGAVGSYTFTATAQRVRE